MRKAIGLLALVIGVAVLASPEFAPLDAQDKKKVKEDPKAKVKAKEKEAAIGTIEIYKAKDGYRYRIKDGDGKTIAMPARGHDTKDEVLQDLEEVKATLNKVKPTEVKD
jgi:hypothetical protein